MATIAKPRIAPVMTAKVTSKGQITIPVEIRRTMGVRPGDSVRFEAKEDGIRVLRNTQENPFEKWRGIGGFPGMGKGREAILTYFREMRGHDDLD
jgi:AbrB family looped-hinge helix DNA binding protein